MRSGKMEPKKLEYADPMTLEVVGTKPGPEKPGLSYDPIYDRMTEVAPTQKLSNYAKEVVRYGETPDMLYGGQKKRVEKYGPDWSYA